ncbi:MAG: hypothetical protein ACI35S_09910 [Anaeroplasma sp.]
MSETKNDEIKRLKYENLIWILFIVACIMNIFADTIQTQFLKTNSENKEKEARELYIFVLILTIIIYMYFANRNYNFLKEAFNNNEDTSLLEYRFIGSILLIIGISFILYYQINSKRTQGSVAI